MNNFLLFSLILLFVDITKMKPWEFPGGLVVKDSALSLLWLRFYLPYATGVPPPKKQNKKKKREEKEKTLH